jgi:hypothetical protein
MPTATEKVLNKALSGAELSEILKHDFVDKLLPNEGMLSAYMAYGRVGYEITLRLMLDNPAQRDYPPLTVTGGEALPLADPSPEATVGATTLTRQIDSPNAERVRVGLPIPVETRELDGTKQVQQIKYPPQPELGEGQVKVEDTTAAARRHLKLDK